MGFKPRASNLNNYSPKPYCDPPFLFQKLCGRKSTFLLCIHICCLLFFIWAPGLPLSWGAQQMINKSTDEYATQFCLNKFRSCWELDKENKAIAMCDVVKTVCPPRQSTLRRDLPATKGPGFFQRCNTCCWRDVPPIWGDQEENNLFSLRTASLASCQFLI